MKIPKIVHAIGHIEDALVAEAIAPVKTVKRRGRVWGAMAACLAVMLMAAVIIVPGMTRGGNPPVPPHTETGESAFEKYHYYVDEGIFSAYVGGKVIAEDRLGERLTEVAVTAGWQNAEGTWLTTERLRAEVYAIDGVAETTAVALRFLDKGDALTTTHYYTFMNLDEDLTALKDYIIAPAEPSSGTEEAALE